MSGIDKDYACAKCGKQPIECKCKDDAVPRVVWCVSLTEWNKLVDEKMTLQAENTCLREAIQTAMQAYNDGDISLGAALMKLEEQALKGVEYGKDS